MKVLIRSIVMLMIIMMMTPSIASVGAIVGTGDEEIREFNDKAVNDFIEEFSVKKHTFDTLSIPVYHPYLIFANVDSFSQKEKNKDWAIDKASWMLDRDLEEEDYVKILISIIELNELSAIDQVDNQHIYDEKYDFGDKWLKSYYKDTMETVLACFNIPEGDLIGKINDVLESIKDGSEAIISSVDGGKYFNLMLQSYAFSQRFLSAIIDNSDNEYLKKAAESLQDAGKNVLEKKIDYFLENSKNITVYGWKQFLKLSYKDLYSSYKNSVDSITTEFLLVSCGKSLYEAKEKYIGGYWGFFFNLMMIGGDFSFATSDTFSIYQELKILCDIAQSLERANSKLTIEDIGSIYDQYNVIYEKCEYYKLLITVDARAEHLTHEMLGNEHNLLSYFDYFTDLIKGEETEDERHEKKNQEILEIDALLNDLVSINVYGRTVYDFPEDAIDNMLPLVNAQVSFFRLSSKEDYYVTSCKNEDVFWNTFGSYCNSNLIPGNDTGEVSLQDGGVIITRSKVIDMGYALFDDFEGVIPDTEFDEYGPISYVEDEDAYHFLPASMHDYIYREKGELQYNDDGTITITYLYEESHWPNRESPETFAYDITFRLNDYVNKASDNPYYYTIISVEKLSESKKNESVADSDDKSQIDDEYILPDSDKRLLTEDDIDELDEEMLMLARNEIYARHGRLFKDENIQSYFNTKSWYKGEIPPEEFQQETLSEIEQTNAEFILKYEKDKKNDEVYDHVISHLQGLWYSCTMDTNGPRHKMLCEGNDFDGEIYEIIEYHEGYLVRIDGGYSYYFGKDLNSCVFVDGWEITENNTYGTSGWWKPNEEQRKEYGD